MELRFPALTFTKEAVSGELASALKAQGLKVRFWQQFLSSERTPAKCRALVESGMFFLGVLYPPALGSAAFTR